MKTSTINWEQIYNFYYQIEQDCLVFVNDQQQRFYYQALAIYDQSILKTFSDHSKNHLLEQLSHIIKPLNEINLIVTKAPLASDPVWKNALKGLNYKIDYHSQQALQVQALATKWQVYQHQNFQKQFLQPVAYLIAYNQDETLLKQIYQSLHQHLNQVAIINQILTTKQLVNLLKDSFHFEHQDRFANEVFEQNIKPTFKDFVNLSPINPKVPYLNQHQVPFYFYHFKNFKKDFHQLGDGQKLFYKWTKNKHQEWILSNQILITKTKQSHLKMIKKWFNYYQNFFYCNQTLKQPSQTVSFSQLNPFNQIFVINPYWQLSKPLMIGNQVRQNLIMTIEQNQNYLIISQNDLGLFYQILTYHHLSQKRLLINQTNDRLQKWIDYFQIPTFNINQFWFNPFGSVIDVNDPLFYKKINIKSEQLWKILKTYQPLIADHLQIFFNQGLQELAKLKNDFNWQGLYLKLIDKKSIKVEDQDLVAYKLLTDTVNLFSIHPHLKAIWTKPQVIDHYEKQVQQLTKWQREWENLNTALQPLLNFVIEQKQLKTKSSTQKQLTNWITENKILIETLLKFEQEVNKNKNAKTKVEDHKNDGDRSKTALEKWLEKSQIQTINDLKAIVLKIINQLAKQLKQQSKQLKQQAKTLPIAIEKLNDDEWNQTLCFDWRVAIDMGWQEEIIATMICAINQLLETKIINVNDQIRAVNSNRIHLSLTDDYEQIKQTSDYLLLINAKQNYDWSQLDFNLNTIDQSHYLYYQPDVGKKIHFRRFLEHPSSQILNDKQDHSYYWFYDQLDQYQSWLYQVDHLDYQKALYEFQAKLKPNQIANWQTVKDNNIFVQRLLWKNQ